MATDHTSCVKHITPVDYYSHAQVMATDHYYSHAQVMATDHTSCVKHITPVDYHRSNKSWIYCWCYGAFINAMLCVVG
jgi:hypothetical protein